MKVKRKLLSGLLAIAILMSIGVVALAAQHTEYPWGGTWNWGEEYRSDVKYAYSNYLLSRNESQKTNGWHKTTVVGKDTSTSDWVKPGVWSYASIRCKAFYLEKCYYNAQDLNGSPKA